MPLPLTLTLSPQLLLLMLLLLPLLPIVAMLPLLLPRLTQGKFGGSGRPIRPPCGRVGHRLTFGSRRHAHHRKGLELHSSILGEHDGPPTLYKTLCKVCRSLGEVLRQ